jgi:lipopolysaccharide export system permease protein
LVEAPWLKVYGLSVMTLLFRYIFRIAATAFLMTLAVLTAVIWLSQALREFDLMTAKGQSVIIFLMITGLSVPALIAIIAPVALFIATIYALNRLNGDSELVVMSAAGVSPTTLARPFMALTLLGAALVAWMTIWAMPSSFRGVRDLITKVRADFVSNVAREGQFTNLDQGITFHYRERAGDALLGIFMQDRRDPEKNIVYIAERGQAVDVNGTPYLVLEQGVVHREKADGGDASLINFQRYAIDLGQFGPDSDVITYKPRERSTFELLWLEPKDDYVKSQLGRFRAELHDRITAPLYALAFVAIAFAALGQPRTTRQGRGFATGMAVLAVVLVRIAGFAVSTLIVRSPASVPLAYLLPLGATAVALAMAFAPSLRRNRAEPALVAKGA